MLEFLGDVFLDDVYKVEFELKNFIFNLEYPLSTKGEPAKNKINLGVKKPNIFDTFKVPPLAVNLANNHIMDYGNAAFNDTIDYLKKHNIQFFGAGNKQNNFNNPCIVMYGNQRIALLGYSCPTTHAVFGDEYFNGSAKIDIERIKEDIAKAKNHADYIVVNLHWGDEEIKYPKPEDVTKAHTIIELGADLIIGHHAHVIQSIERYKKKYIFYGIGNFIFPDFDVPSSYDGKSFLKRSIKKQSELNRQSIVVDLDEDLKISYKTVVFEDECVKERRVSIPSWIPKKQVSYNLYKVFWSKKRMIKIFFENPRLPTMKQIKLVFGLKI